MRLPCLLATALLLAACGRTGGLYLPGHPEQATGTLGTGPSLRDTATPQPGGLEPPGTRPRQPQTPDVTPGNTQASQPRSSQ